MSLMACAAVHLASGTCDLVDRQRDQLSVANLGLWRSCTRYWSGRLWQRCSRWTLGCRPCGAPACQTRRRTDVPRRCEWYGCCTRATKYSDRQRDGRCAAPALQWIDQWPAAFTSYRMQVEAHLFDVASGMRCPHGLHPRVQRLQPARAFLTSTECRTAKAEIATGQLIALAVDEGHKVAVAR